MVVELAPAANTHAHDNLAGWQRRGLLRRNRTRVMSCANKQPISAINANAFEAPFIGAIGAIASRSSLRDLLVGKWLYIFGDSSGRGLYLALYQQLVADAASYDNDSTLLVLPGQADPGISARAPSNIRSACVDPPVDRVPLCTLGQASPLPPPPHLQPPSSPSPPPRACRSPHVAKLLVRPAGGLDRMMWSSPYLPVLTRGMLPSVTRGRSDGWMWSSTRATGQSCTRLRCR